MAEIGRPSKLTPAVTEKILQALQLGNYRKQAALYAGIDEATFRRWLRKGRTETEGPYAEFRKAVFEAEAKAEITAVGCISKAIRDGDWKAAAWRLERRRPEQFAPRSRLFDPHRVVELLEDEGLLTDRDKALTALAESEPGLNLSDGTDDGFDDIEVSDEMRDLLFGTLRDAEKPRTVEAKVVDP